MGLHDYQIVNVLGRIANSFERIVAAHEKLADAQTRLARVAEAERTNPNGTKF
jgi:hypothetical protein